MPCASRAHCTLHALLCTTSISRLCDDPLGAVRLALGPSYCTADPDTRTSVSLLSDDNKNDPHPSPRQYPSARSSKVWHHPYADSIPAAENASVTESVSIPTPVTVAQGHSISFKAETPKCKATSDDEHAVSSDRHGPVSPSVYETRPDNTESAPEVPEYTEGASVCDEEPPP